MSEYVVILVTFPSLADAEKCADVLLSRKLVACTNITQEISSLFWWQGKIDSADEVLMLAKSTQSLFSEITDCIQAHHPYDVPEIIALPIIAGSEAYLKWITESVKG
jgi:periplasmic divalent cation tolerance protein